MIKLWGILRGLLIQDHSDRTKQLSIEVDSSASSSSRTTLKSIQTTDRTLNLPDADDTLIGKVTVDILENKTINADNNTISNLEHGSEVDNPSSGVHGVVGNIVGTSDTQTLTNKSIDADNNPITNIQNSNIKTGAAIDVSKIGNGDVDNTELSYVNGVTSAIQTQLNDKEDIANKGSANGYASLDGSGKVPAAQLPNAIMEYQGTYNASTNTPSLVDGGTNPDESIGNVYRVSVAGTQDFGSGNISFEVGDYVILNSSKIWEKSDTTDAVSSVNGQTGAVNLALDNLSDVDTTGVIDGDVLTYNSGTWEASTPSTSNIPEYSAKTGNYTLTVDDDTVAFTTGGTNLTADLPDATVTPVGKTFTLVKIDSGAGHLAIDGFSAQSISDRLVYYLYQKDNSITIQNTGSNWKIISSNVTDIRFATKASNQVLASDGVVEDVSSLSLSLPIGTWKIRYSVSARLQKLTAAGSMYGQVKLTDSLNNIYSNSASFFGASSVGISNSIYSPLNGEISVNLTSAETVKLRAEFTDLGSSGSGEMTIVAAGFSFFTGSADGAAILVAERLS